MHVFLILVWRLPLFRLGYGPAPPFRGSELESAGILKKPHSRVRAFASSKRCRLISCRPTYFDRGNFHRVAWTVRRRDLTEMGTASDYLVLVQACWHSMNDQKRPLERNWENSRKVQGGLLNFDPFPLLQGFLGLAAATYSCRAKSPYAPTPSRHATWLARQRR